MSRFLESVSTIISVFHQHAKEDGGCSKLSRRKMKEFIEWEFADVIAKPHDSQTIDKILQFLEWDGDGEIDFNEFLLLVFRVAKACYWYLPEGPCLLQKTKLNTSGKLLQEAERKNRGSQWQLQTCEPQAPPNQRSSRQADKPATQRPQRAERGSHNQPELIRGERSSSNLHVLEQKPVERRRHETCEPECLDPKRPHQSYIQEPQEIDLRSYEGYDVERHIDEKRREDEYEYQETGREIQQDEEWEEQHRKRRKEPVRERRVDRRRELELELDISERRSRQTWEREEREPKSRQRETRDRRDCRTQEPEEDPRRQRESVRYERTRERTVAAAEADVKVQRVTRVLKPRDEVERRDRQRECEEPQEERRVCTGPEKKELVRERRVDRELDLELDISERRSRQTWEREEREPKTRQRETCDRRDCRTQEPEEDPKRQRESVRYERTQERTVATAEADLKVQRVTRVLEPRDEVERRDCQRECEEPQEERRVCTGPERKELVRERTVDRELDLELDISERRSRQTWERKERDDTTNQRETRDRRDCRTEDPEEDPRRQRESVRYERTRERTVVAAEADLNVHRITRVLEPRDEVERRDRQRDCEEPQEERRVCKGPEKKELVRERRVDRELDLELDISERRSHQTWERKERDDTANQRETCDRRDCRTQEPEEDPRRQRKAVRYERTRETSVATAEADLNVHRVTRVLEPRDDVERRDRQRECEDPREERRVCKGSEREEPVLERRVDRELELELDISERRSRQTWERKERDDTTNQRETRDRRDCRTEDPEEDPRRQRESVRYERTRERTVAAAEADLKVHRVTQVLEPRDDVERRDRQRECEDPREERRVCKGPERKELVRERRVDRELDLELDISERRQTWEREEREPKTRQRETHDRRDCRTQEPEEDPRRQRDSLRYERTRETSVAAVEADLNVHRVTRVLEPRDEVERRDRQRECEEPQRESRVCTGPERKELVRERRVDRELDLELDISERRSRQTWEREEREPKSRQRETCDRRDCRTQEPEEDPRRQRESVRYERTRERTVAAAEADVKVQRVTRVLEPRDDVERRDCQRECEEPQEERRVCKGPEKNELVRERRVDRELDLELNISERRSRQTWEREEREPKTRQRETCDRRDCRTQEPEEDPRRQRESVRYERTRERTVAAAEADLKVQRVTRVLEPRDEVERRDRDCEEPQRDRRVCKGPEREEPVRERRVDRELDLELDISERRSRQTWEREERDDTANQRETRDRRDCRTQEPQEDPRRQREAVRYERTRETSVATAGADLNVHRVTHVLEPRDDVERRDRDCEEPQRETRVCKGSEREEPVLERRFNRQRELDLELDISERRQTWEREEREPKTRQRETRDRRDCRTQEPEEDPRRQRDSLRYERTRETSVAAVEADLNVHRVTRVQEPRDDVERRDRQRECEEPQRESRVCTGPERKELVRERRVDRELDLELDISERRSRQTWEREEREPKSRQRETCDRRDCRTQEPEEDPRRQRESVRYERTRETSVAAVEADLNVHRVTRVLEPRDDVERRDCQRECEEPQEERRVCKGPEKNELVRERRVDRELDLELNISERRSRQTWEREEREPKSRQRETCDRRDCRTQEPEEDPRRQRESVRYERTRERTVAAAEADLKVQRVTRVLEPRDEVERRDRDCEEPQRDRRVCKGSEREEPVRERRVDRELDLELDISERRSRQTWEREEQEPKSRQRETRDRRDCRTEDPEEDPRRQRESVRYERTRERTVAAAEADLKVQRVTRVQEPRDDVERRDRQRECEEPQEERRVCKGPEKKELVRERRVDRELDLELDISERRSRQTWEREERGTSRSSRDTRERSSLQIVEEEEADIILSEPLDEEWRDNGLPEEDETREPTRRLAPEDGRRRRERSLYQTVVMENKDLCPPGEQAAVSDMRIRYIPDDPEVQPEVQVLPQSCKPQTIAYLIHVIQNLNDPEATTYEITCQQPNDPRQPLYVKKCHVAPQPPAVLCDGREQPEPRPQRDEREPLQKGDTPASRSQENTRDADEPQERSKTGVKEGGHQASASEPDGVKGKIKEGRRDRQHPRLPDEEEHQPQEEGSKASREQTLWEPESSCPLSQEAKSCPPLPQAPEPRETCEPGRRGEASSCQEDAEVPLTKKSYQPCQEDNSKRNPQQGSNSQPQREEEPQLHTKQSSLVSQKAPSCPDRDETKAS